MNGGFKIIAIKPLKGCSKNVLKLIREEETYYFYNNYKINKDDRITMKEVIPSSFYDVNGISVNISAIVGKNGSGKSTVIELLLRIINNVAINRAKSTEDMIELNGLKVDLYFCTDTYYKIRINGAIIKAFKYSKNSQRINIPMKDFSIRKFFYTLVVNYSHYAYNPNDLINEEDWYYGLFHKNDGYQTPLVLNPFRNQGNIDVNSENYLAKSRLVSYLLLPITDNKDGTEGESSFDFRRITDNLIASSLRLKLKKSKESAFLYEITNNKKEKEIVTLLDIKSIGSSRGLGTMAA